MISQTVEYALRAVVTLAQQEGQPTTARRLSEITQLPSTLRIGCDVDLRKMLI